MAILYKYKQYNKQIQFSKVRKLNNNYLCILNIEIFEYPFSDVHLKSLES